MIMWGVSEVKKVSYKSQSTGRELVLFMCYTLNKERMTCICARGAYNFYVFFGRNRVQSCCVHSKNYLKYCNDSTYFKEVLHTYVVLYALDLSSWIWKKNQKSAKIRSPQRTKSVRVALLLYGSGWKVTRKNYEKIKKEEGRTNK